MAEIDGSGALTVAGQAYLRSELDRRKRERHELAKQRIILEEVVLSVTEGLPKMRRLLSVNGQEPVERNDLYDYTTSFIPIAGTDIGALFPFGLFTKAATKFVETFFYNTDHLQQVIAQKADDWSSSELEALKKFKRLITEGRKNNYASLLSNLSIEIILENAHNANAPNEAFTVEVKYTIDHEEVFIDIVQHNQIPPYSLDDVASVFDQPFVVESYYIDEVRVFDYSDVGGTTEAKDMKDEKEREMAASNRFILARMTFVWEQPSDRIYESCLVSRDGFSTVRVPYESLPRFFKLHPYHAADDVAGNVLRFMRSAKASFIDNFLKHGRFDHLVNNYRNALLRQPQHLVGQQAKDTLNKALAIQAFINQTAGNMPGAQGNADVVANDAAYRFILANADHTLRTNKLFRAELTVILFPSHPNRSIMIKRVSPSNEAYPLHDVLLYGIDQYGLVNVGRGSVFGYIV